MSKKIIYNALFALGYVAIMWPELYAVRNGWVSTWEAAAFETLYIIFGSIFLAVKT